ncbi:MAG TPA: LysM peptidoglycan-binding domain-containing protein, partial [Methyloceanibacter sp.]|nr:LysM peptidoglycan-binding domain-containing protein [Methyloceanibacter sp.]
MLRASFLWDSGRGSGLVLFTACLGLSLAGCSSSASRFNFPAFGLNGSDQASNADLATTSSLPVPEESVYTPGSGDDARVQRAALPSPAYSPRPDAYSPAPNKRVGAAPSPYGESRAQVQGHRIKVAKGDTLSTLSRRYGVPVETIVSANNLPDGRLAVGQQLVLPGVTAAKAAAVAKAEPNVRVVKTETIAAPQGTSLAQEEAAEAAGANEGSKQASVAGNTAGNTPQVGAKRVASVDQLPAPDPMSGNFRWPV